MSYRKELQAEGQPWRCRVERQPWEYRVEGQLWGCRVEGQPWDAGLRGSHGDAGLRGSQWNPDLKWAVLKKHMPRQSNGKSGGTKIKAWQGHRNDVRIGCIKL